MKKNWKIKIKTAYILCKKGSLNKTNNQHTEWYLDDPVTKHELDIQKDTFYQKYRLCYINDTDMLQQ